MMFKVIPMHTKPLKHAKYNEIITHTSKTHMFSKFLTNHDLWQNMFLSQNLMLCMHVRMHDSDYKKYKTS